MIFFVYSGAIGGVNGDGGSDGGSDDGGDGGCVGGGGGGCCGDVYLDICQNIHIHLDGDSSDKGPDAEEGMVEEGEDYLTDTST